MESRKTEKEEKALAEFRKSSAYYSKTLVALSHSTGMHKYADMEKMLQTAITFKQLISICDDYDRMLSQNKGEYTITAFRWISSIGNRLGVDTLGVVHNVLQLKDEAIEYAIKNGYEILSVKEEKPSAAFSK